MKSLLCAVAFSIICAGAVLWAQDDNSSGILILKDGKETSTKPTKPDIEMPREQPAPPPQTYGAIYDRWKEFEQAYQSGNTKEETAILNQIIELKEADSVLQISDLAVSAVQYGNTEI